MPGPNNKWNRLGATRRAAPAWQKLGEKLRANQNKANQAAMETNLFNALKAANQKRTNNLVNNNAVTRNLNNTVSRKRKNRRTRRRN